MLPHVARVGFDEDQRRDPLGMGGAVADDIRTGMVRPDEHDPLTPHGVEHRREVGIDDLFDVAVPEGSA